MLLVSYNLLPFCDVHPFLCDPTYYVIGPVNTVKTELYSRIAAIGDEMQQKEKELVNAAKSSYVLYLMCLVGSSTNCDIYVYSDGLDLSSYQDSMNRLAKDAAVVIYINPMMFLIHQSDHLNACNR
jgi:hypothetical protein